MYLADSTHAAHKNRFSLFLYPLAQILQLFFAASKTNNWLRKRGCNRCYSTNYLYLKSFFSNKLKEGIG